jgi:hypothetical protein
MVKACSLTIKVGRLMVEVALQPSLLSISTVDLLNTIWMSAGPKWAPSQTCTQFLHQDWADQAFSRVSTVMGRKLAQNGVWKMISSRATATVVEHPHCTLWKVTAKVLATKEVVTQITRWNHRKCT